MTSMKSHSNFRFQQIFAVFLILIALANVSYKFFQTSDGALRFNVKGDTAYAYGVTDWSSMSTVNDLLRDHPNLDRIVLRHMGGTQDADTNLRIARRLRRAGISTHLERRSYIASGAVDLFLSGVERTMECGARIGVHSWSYGDTGFSPREAGYDERQNDHEKFLRDMGIDQSFYVFTREAAPPERIYVMTPEEINRFALTSEPLQC